MGTVNSAQQNGSAALVQVAVCMPSRNALLFSRRPDQPPAVKSFVHHLTTLYISSVILYRKYTGARDTDLAARGY
jgi:hypothetical protein